MTTREEKIQTINDRLNELNDEDLEKIAGGLPPLAPFLIKVGVAATPILIDNTPAIIKSLKSFSKVGEAAPDYDLSKAESRPDISASGSGNAAPNYDLSKF